MALRASVSRTALVTVPCVGGGGSCFELFFLQCLKIHIFRDRFNLDICLFIRFLLLAGIALQSFALTGAKFQSAVLVCSN